jgi:hypothetical protein
MLVNDHNEEEEGVGGYNENCADRIILAVKRRIMIAGKVLKYDDKDDDNYGRW